MVGGIIIMISAGLDCRNTQMVVRLNYILLFLSATYLLYGLLAPFFYLFKLPYAYEYYRIGRSLCVQRPSRCFWYFNDHTALCSKCLGLYLGILIASISVIFNKIKISKITGFIAIGLLAMFSLMAMHSIIRSYYGWLLLPVDASFGFGIIGGFSFALLCTYLTLKLRGIPMLFSGKRWLFVVIIVIILHIWGFTNALAQDAQTSENKNAVTSDEEIKALKTEIIKLKKEKQAQEMKNEATKLKRELEALKQTEKAKEMMKRPLPKSAQGAPLMAPIQRVLVHNGTPIILQVETGFSTNDVKEGDTIVLRVQRALKVNEVIVVRRGVAARAIVATCKPAQSWGGGGDISIKLKSVPAVDGSEIMVNGGARRQGESSHGEATAVAVGTGVLCLPLALTGAAVTGEDGKFPPGYEIVAHADGDQQVKIFTEEEQLRIFKEQEQEAEELSEKFKKQIKENLKKRKEEQKASDNME